MATQTPLSAPAGPLYQNLVLEHYRRPRNRGTLPDPTHQASVSNPLCGDDLTLALRLRSSVVEAAAFSGRCCAVSQAAASLLTEAIKGNPVESVLELCREFQRLMQGDRRPAADDSLLGELRNLADLARFPARVPCALLPVRALERAILELSD